MDASKSLVGKVFCFTWGYSMTLVTFLKVIKETAKTVTVVELGQEHSGEFGFSEVAIPTDLHKVDFDKNEKIHRAIKTDKYDAGGIKGSFGMSCGTYYASEWNGKPVHINTCD